MKNKHSLSAIMVVLLIISMVFMGTSMTGSATSSGGTLILKGSDDMASSISGVEYTIYKVGNVKNEYELTDDFKGSNISLNDLTDSSIKKIAATLQTYVKNKKIAGLATVAADSTGSVKFSNLDAGVYLILQSSESSKIQTSPMFIPIREFTGGQLVTTLKAEQVPGTQPETQPEKETSFEVHFSKTDLNGTELAGAELSVYLQGTDGQKIGDPVANWTSDGSAYTLTETVLKANTEYVLVEESAPSGYLVASPIGFKVSDSGTVSVKNTGTQKYEAVENSTVTMKDEPITVNFEKVDGQGNALQGATLLLKNSDGVVIMSGEVPQYQWTTDGTVYTIEALPAGVYYLSELNAPTGYSYATDICFTVNADGTVSVDGKTVKSVKMVDTALVIDDTLGKIQVSKNVFYGDLQLFPGDGSEMTEEDSVFHVALFADSEFKQKVSEILTIDMRNEDTRTALFENLSNGEYYVVETNEYGSPIALLDPEEVSYMPDMENDGLVTVEKNTTQEVAINNYFDDYPDGYYIEEETETNPEENFEDYSSDEDDETTTAQNEEYQPSKSSTTKQPTATTGTSKTGKSVYTGDQIRSFVIWCVVFVVAVVAVIILFKTRKKKDKK